MPLLRIITRRLTLALTISLATLTNVLIISSNVVHLNPPFTFLVDNLTLNWDARGPGPSGSCGCMIQAAAAAGAWELQKSKPPFQTHHINSPKTTNFMGISKPIQSILTFSFYLQLQVLPSLTTLLLVVNRKIIGGKQPIFIL